jgi:integral membrane protein
MAWIVGVMLLVVTAATIVKYVADEPRWIELVGPPHGFLYVLYLVTVLDLGLRVRWSPLKVIGICLAGTVPFLSFYIEHRMTIQVKSVIAEVAQTAVP